MLGYINEFSESQQINTEELSHFDNLMLLKTHEFAIDVGQAYEDLNFNSAYDRIRSYLGDELAPYLDMVSLF